MIYSAQFPFRFHVTPKPYIGMLKLCSVLFALIARCANVTRAIGNQERPIQHPRSPREKVGIAKATSPRASHE